MFRTAEGVYTTRRRLSRLFLYYKKNGSVDLGHHTRGHTRYALGTHTHQHKETPPHSNGAKAHTRQERCEFRQRSRRPLHRRGPPRPRHPRATAHGQSISHAAAMCSATDMRCAINDDHVRVVQLTSSSYCFLDNLSYITHQFSFICK